jgi:hypothetical protein
MVHDTPHSHAAELHMHAAYEHWVADYRQERGEEKIAAEFAARAYAHSNQAAEFSKEAYRSGPVTMLDQRTPQISASRT